VSLIVDLSNVNAGPIDWAGLKSHGAIGVMLKATEGETFRDATFASRRAAARKAGLRVGAYHFARPDLHLSPAHEAHSFAQAVGQIGRRDLKVALDFETWNPHMSAAQHVNWARQFNAAILKALGQYPMFYSYSAMLHDMAPGTGGKPIGNGLWLASYARNTGKEYPAVAPAPWKKWALHQFTSNGVIAGAPGHVDISKVISLNGILAHPLVGRV
jgi:lysozyme